MSRLPENTYESLLFMLEEKLLSDHLTLDFRNESGVYGDHSGYTAWVKANGSLYEVHGVDDLFTALRFAIERDWQGISDLIAERTEEPPRETVVNSYHEPRAL